MDKLYPNLIKVAFRIHTNVPLTEGHALLKSYKHHAGHIVALEVDAERPHLQGYFLLSNKDNNLQIFRKWLKKTFGLEGNKDYSLSKVKNSEDYKKYIVKETNWMSSGFDVEELKKFQLVSYPKKKNFQKELDLLEIEYLLDNMDDIGYIFNFIKLKANYKQVVNTNYVKQRLIMMRSKKSLTADDGWLMNYATELYNNFFN